MAKAKNHTDHDQYQTFHDMNLKQELLMSIQQYGYSKPTAVQQKIIGPLFKGSDLLVQVADFEPGKTSAICLGILQNLNCESGLCQAVIFTSTDASSRRIGKDMEKLGGPLGTKVHILGDNPCFPPLYQVIVATPSKYMLWLDFVDRRYWTKHIQVVVFDKADQMLEYELSCVFPVPRVAFFTETVPDKVKIAANMWSKTRLETITVPHTIQLDKKVEGNHFVLCVPDAKMKFDALQHLYLNIQEPSVIFVNEPETVMHLYQTLKVWGWLTVFCITEDTDENARALIETTLQSPAASVLITTDEWANDIDLMQVRMVVNYDLPTPYYKPQDYIRRMSRFGGRAEVFNIIIRDEWFKVFEIQRDCGNSVVFEGYPPSIFDSENDYSNSTFLEGYLQEENVEYLPFPCPEATEDIHHVLIRIDEEEDKVDTIWYELSNYFGKGKAVVFAEDDRGKKLLGDIRFNVFTTQNLQEFLMSPLECCILLVDRVEDTLKDAHPKVPVVFNFDIPLDKFVYGNRMAWCAEGGFVVHLATDDDYLKMIYFQLPRRRVFCWLSNSNEIAEIVQKASSKLVGLVQPETFYLSPARISEAGLDQELICPAVIPASATLLEETTPEPFDTTPKPRTKKSYTWMGAWEALNKRARKSKFYKHTI